jgi:uncharacterized membrane protein YfcA
MHITVLSGLAIFIIAFFMSMVGKGGGNFYIMAMAAAGVSMHNAASTSQLIMISTSIVAMLIFHKHKKVDWKLALIIDPPTDIMALLGGYVSGGFSGNTMKIIFSVLLILVSIFMFIPVKEQNIKKAKKFGYLKRKFGGNSYVVNLWLAVPITAIVGFFAGAIGISGGTFKIPLMVLACGVPMEIAVGTSSAMVAVTALMGLIGHSVNGNFNAMLALPLACVAVVGGLIGSKLAVKSRPANLKTIFAIINLVSAALMLLSIMV